jgi:hypothetical protein
MRQHTSAEAVVKRCVVEVVGDTRVCIACVSMRQHTSAEAAEAVVKRCVVEVVRDARVCIACVSIRQQRQ